MSKGKKIAVIIISVILTIVLICVSVYLVFPGSPYYIAAKIIGGKDLDSKIQTLTDAAPINENIQIIETDGYTVNIPNDFTEKETESGTVMYELGDKLISFQAPVDNFATNYEEELKDTFEKLSPELKEYFNTLHKGYWFDEHISMYSYTTKDFTLRHADKSALLFSFLILKKDAFPENTEFYYYENEDIRVFFIMSGQVNSAQFICKNHTDNVYQIVFRDMTIDDMASVFSTLKFKENGPHTEPLPEGY